MEGLPGTIMRSSVALFTGAASGFSLAMVLIGSAGDLAGHAVAAVLTYAILATAMVASVCGFMVPVDSVAEKWRDLSTSCVTRSSVGFASRVLRDAKPMTVLGVALTSAGVFWEAFGNTKLLIPELGVATAFASELATFSTATAAAVVVILQQVQALDHWDERLRPVWLAGLVLMVTALWHILSRVVKVACAFLAACVAGFYASLFLLMILLTPLFISIHCLHQCLGPGLSSMLITAVGSATVVGVQGAVGPAALLIPCSLLYLSHPSTQLGHGFLSLAIPIITALWIAKSNVWAVEYDLKHVLALALGVKAVRALSYVVKFALFFAVPAMLAISAAVAVQILGGPGVEAYRGRLLAWAGKGAALGSALALRMFGGNVMLYGLGSFMVISAALCFVFWTFCCHLLPNAQDVASQRVSQLGGMYMATLVIGCGVVLIPRHLGLVMTGLGVYIAIKTMQLMLELEKEDSTLPGRAHVVNEDDEGIEENMGATHRSWG